MSKTITISLLLSVIAPISSIAAHHGFYIGLSGEESSIIVHNTTTTQPLPKTNLSGNTLGGYAGYQFFLSRDFLLSAEVFANASNSKAKVTSTSGSEPYSFEQQKRFSFGASLLPTYQDQNLDFFIRLGIIDSRFHHSSDDDLLGNFDEYHTGWQSGFGAAFMLTGKVSLRGEYDFINYPAFNKGNYTFDSVEQSFIVGLSYFFDKQNLQSIYWNSFQGTKRFISKTQLPFSQPYFAVGIGSQNGLLKTTTHNTQQSLGFSGLSTLLSMGWNARLNQHNLLGLSTSYRIQHDQNSDYQMDNAADASIISGYLFDARQLLYLKAGASWLDIRHNSQDSFKFNRWQPGFLLGVGYQFALNNHLSMKLEYSRYIYHSYTLATASGSLTITPRQGIGTIQLAYAF